uniref:Major facilitator superfamily (MFS) profile domain-containing protein n=1 Tax=Timema monikensis TaxID=170555 RepID=A0A7R9EGI9_9NEOP|nr:unnamed protein product [Timema monikensis]
MTAGRFTMAVKPKEGKKLVAPDGGWGWMVVIGASFINMERYFTLMTSTGSLLYSGSTTPIPPSPPMRRSTILSEMYITSRLCYYCEKFLVDISMAGTSTVAPWLLCCELGQSAPKKPWGYCTTRRALYLVLGVIFVKEDSKQQANGGWLVSQPVNEARTVYDWDYNGPLGFCNAFLDQPAENWQEMAVAESPRKELAKNIMATTQHTQKQTLATRSIEPSFGLLFGDTLKELNVATTGASVIMSTLDGMINFSGLFVGPLIRTYSYRKVGLFGAFLSALGLLLTAPASSMAHILATYSIIGGLGVGFATTAGFVALNHYFSKYRGQAVGLSMAGTALGFMVMPQAVQLLLSEYDFQGSVLVLGGVALHSVVGSLLLQPIKWHMRPAKEEEDEDEKEEDLPEKPQHKVGHPPSPHPQP